MTTSLFVSGKKLRKSCAIIFKCFTIFKIHKHSIHLELYFYWSHCVVIYFFSNLALLDILDILFNKFHLESFQMYYLLLLVKVLLVIFEKNQFFFNFGMKNFFFIQKLKKNWFKSTRNQNKQTLGCSWNIQDANKNLDDDKNRDKYYKNIEDNMSFVLTSEFVVFLTKMYYVLRVGKH